jgi:hypothetical protein
MNTPSASVSGLRTATTIALQSAVAVLLLGGLLLSPPTQGPMMLVPMTAAAARALPALALRGDTRLIATGPLPGSLLVYGRRADLALPMIRHATLTLGSPAAGCTATRGAA